MKYKKFIKQYFAPKPQYSQSQVALAIVAGLAAGAIISILFAPDKGTKTREKIVGGAKNLGYGFQDKYNLLREKVFGVEAIEKDIAKQKAKVLKNKSIKEA